MRKGFLWVIFLIGIVFISGCISQNKETSTNPAEKSIAKSPSDFLPTRGDLSTEWILDDNTIDLKTNSTGFDSGTEQSMAIGSYPLITIVTASIYKFSSKDASNDYYSTKIAEDEYLQIGGYKEVDIKIGEKCQAYKISGINGFGKAYCINSNVVFELTALSNSGYNAEKYMKEISKIISQKLN